MSLFQLISGECIKNKIIRKNENDLYFIFPENDGLVSYYGLLYSEEYMKEIKADRLVIVTSDKLIRNSAEKMISRRHRIIVLSRRKMRDLLFCLSLHSDLMGLSIEKNLFYISKTYPFGNSSKAFLDGGYFSEEYFVWNRILHMGSFYYAKLPEVKGSYSKIYDQFKNI